MTDDKAKSTAPGQRVVSLHTIAFSCGLIGAVIVLIMTRMSADSSHEKWGVPLAAQIVRLSEVKSDGEILGISTGDYRQGEIVVHRLDRTSQRWTLYRLDPDLVVGQGVAAWVSESGKELFTDADDGEKDKPWRSLHQDLVLSLLAGLMISTLLGMTLDALGFTGMHFSNASRSKESSPESADT